MTSKPESLTENRQCEILVVGTGTAGLSFALKAAAYAKVTLLAKESVSSTNSAMAQGGISAVMGADDSFESHVQDTLIAGAGLCKSNIVKNYVEQAPDRIQDLLNWGVHFDLHTNAENPKSIDPKDLDLTREGGHSFRRILHHEDQTGLEIHNTLLKSVLKNPNITLLENTFAIDLLLSKKIDPLDSAPNRCVGCYALNKTSGEVFYLTAKEVILATGGSGKVYQYTSNWSGATGDGIAMAYRAGARVANLEFMQFHPTCLYHKDSRNFLISEALRGEGGVLVTKNREPFMEKYHPLKSLAPRDIVARSIDNEMKKSGAECVYLDMTHLKRDFLEARFPFIFKKCMELGIDMSIHPIPVVPAAHYFCGGVLTDVNGRTDIPGLWTIGEAACNGFHGANRLASNSLLECLTMAHNASEQIQKEIPQIEFLKTNPGPWRHPTSTDEDEMIVIHHMWDEIRMLMWNYVGIVRSNKRLERAAHRMGNILQEVQDYYSEMKIHSDILELRNIAIVASLSIECALRRKESRGIHYSLNYPQQSPEPEDTILGKGL